MKSGCRKDTLGNLGSALVPKTAGSGQARVLTPTELDLLFEAAPSPEHRARPRAMAAGPII